MLDVKLLQKVIVKNMLKIANGAKDFKGGDADKMIEKAVKELHDDYEKENVHSDIDMENIDWSKVKVIKENE